MDGQRVAHDVAEDKSQSLKKITQTSILDTFSKLEVQKETSRVAAGISLLRNLLQKQQESEEVDNCQEIKYVLKRIIRSLGTSNPWKRAGFFSVLVEMLHLFPGITIEEVLKVMDNELDIPCSSSKKEVTEAYVGRALVIGAMIHSGILFKEEKSKQADIMGSLISVAKKKNILYPCVVSFLMDYMDKCDDDHFKEIWLLLKSELKKSWEEHTPDSMYLLLEARKRFPKIVNEKFIFKSLGTEEVISLDSLTPCAALLMNSFVDHHPLYKEVIVEMCSADYVGTFWTALVREYETRRSQRKEEALLTFFENILEHISDKSQIPDFLSCSFMEMIIKILETRKIKAILAQKITGTFMKITKYLESKEIDDDVRISFIKCILFFPGHLLFDKLAGTNIVLTLASHIKKEGIKKIGKMLKDVISARKPKVRNAQGDTCLWSNRERVYATQLFTRLLCSLNTEEHMKWKLKQLQFLVSYGLIALPQTNGIIRNIVVADEIRKCIFKILNQKVSRIDQLVTLLRSFVYHLNDLLFQQNNPSRLRQPLSELSVEAWHRMIAAVREIESIEETADLRDKSSKNVFLVLFLHMGLQLLQNPTLAEETLQELHSCFERTKSETAQLKKKKRKHIENVSPSKEEEPYWIEVIVDLLLSLLSSNSSLLRNLVSVVFPHLCSSLTPTSVHQIIEVLNPLGKQPLSNNDNSAESEAEEMDEDEEEDTKREIEETDNDIEEKEGDDDDDDEDDEDDDDDDDDDVTGNDPVDAHLKLAVHNALKKAGGACSGSDEESVDMDQMTEEQRIGLDAALSEAFKLLKSQNRKKQSKNDEAVMHFRVRVMDLIDMYLSNQPALALVLDIILPLFELLEFCIKDDHQTPLESRVRSSLRKLASVKHFSSVEGVDEELLSVVLKRLLQKGERIAAVYQNMSEPLVQCSSFLARTFCLLRQQHLESFSGNLILTIYEEALVTFFNQRDSLLPLDVFKALLSISWKEAWKLAEIVVNFAFDSSIRQFRRHQALKLLLAFLTNRIITENTLEYNEKLQEMEKKISMRSIKVLKNAVESKERKEFSTPEVNEIFVKELLSVLLSIHRLHSKRKSIVPDAVDWEAVKDAISHYWNVMSLSTDVKVQLKKFACEFHISLSKKEGNTKQKKPFLDTNKNGVSGSETEDENLESDNNLIDEDLPEIEDDTTEGKTHKKRKKPKVNNMKGKAILKKASKEARIETLSAGLDNSLSFTSVKLHELQAETTETGSVTPTKKRKLDNMVNDNNGTASVDGVPKISQKLKRKDRKIRKHITSEGTKRRARFTV